MDHTVSTNEVEGHLNTHHNSHASLMCARVLSLHTQAAGVDHTVSTDEVEEGDADELASRLRAIVMEVCFALLLCDLCVAAVIRHCNAHTPVVCHHAHWTQCIISDGHCSPASVTAAHHAASVEQLFARQS